MSRRSKVPKVCFCGKTFFPWVGRDYRYGFHCSLACASSFARSRCRKCGSNEVRYVLPSGNLSVCRVCKQRQRALIPAEVKASYQAKRKALRAVTPGMSRAENLRSRHGITEAQFSDMLFAQGGGCAICKRTDSGSSRWKTLHVDHCHQTGVIRGLLCHGCNVSIGHFKDSPELLRRAAMYVEAAR